MANTGANKKGSANKFFIILAICVVVFMLGFAISYRFAVTTGSSDRDSVVSIDPDKGIPVEIPLGANTEKIAQILKEQNLIDSERYFKFYSNINGYDGTYKSGTHILAKGLDFEDIMKVLGSNPVSVKVRISEGSTINQVADALLKKSLISDKEKFINTAKNEAFNYKFLQDTSKRDTKIEGYLFPDTYEFGLKANEKEILKVMLDNFNDRFKPNYYDKAKKLGLTVDQVVTIASILEKEANNFKDRAMIAQIFYNRMNSKDKTLKRLQSCATVQYVFFNRKTGVSDADLKRIGEGKIGDKETSVDDPYNTYKVEGLPLGPICSPSLESIEAALNPDLEAKENGYLFFVAKGDGTHAYSNNYAEHEQNRIKYQK